jgi:hypothetical protein
LGTPCSWLVSRLGRARWHGPMSAFPAKSQRTPWRRCRRNLWPRTAPRSRPERNSARRLP